MVRKKSSGGSSVKPTAGENAQLALLLRSLRKEEPNLLEEFTADIFTRLLSVQVSVAKNGFQAGGDAGPAGRGRRQLRIECKRYGESNPLRDRELDGEIDQAIRRNPDLEVWILVATREVSETTQDLLNQKAMETGVPVVVLDWSERAGALPDLAALCAWGSDLISARYGAQAGGAAAALAHRALETVDRIRSELEPWRIGYEQILATSHQRLEQIWNSKDDAVSAFGQDVAGGLAYHLVRRKAVSTLLQDWWGSTRIRPAIVHGWEGVGKTWAVMHWLLEQRQELPLILPLPSSSFFDIRLVSETSVVAFLATQLHEMTPRRGGDFWRRRLERMLERPVDEGPTLLILIDGANQESSFQWLRLVQILQGGVFARRARLIITTQTHFYEERLYGLRNNPGAYPIGVEPYGIEPGGELDEMLSKHGLAPDSLSPELKGLARFPRLFPLVVKLKTDASLEGDATPLRLLWAHGRDELGLRDGRALNEGEWERWLAQLAQRHWEAIQAHPKRQPVPIPYTATELDAAITSHTFPPSTNYSRLLEIIDGTWMESVPGSPGAFRPKESTIHLALGAAVLRRLEDADANANECVDSALDSWLDPIAATGTSAEVLAAALSIAVAKKTALTSAVLKAVVSALLRSQNAQDGHRRQVVAFAPVLYSSLLALVEVSSSRASASAKHWALLALRSISMEHRAAWGEIEASLVRWVAHLTCPDPSPTEDDHGVGKHRADRLVERVGVAAPGEHRLLGVPVRFHLEERADLAESIPGLLFGKPLVAFRRVFAAAAVVGAVDVKSNAWNGLKWLVAFNDLDPTETLSDLIRMSEAASVLDATDGVHPEFAKRVSALLLWLSGQQEQERQAYGMRVSYERGFDYEEDYLAHPTTSLLPLEHRHVELLWKDNGIVLSRRLNRAGPYLPDPVLEVPSQFRQQVRAFAQQLNVAGLDTSLWTRDVDHTLDEHTVGFARVCPDELAGIAKRWFEGLPSRSGEHRHWASVRATRYLILADETVSQSVRQLREQSPPEEAEQEEFIQSILLELELLHIPIDSQLDTLVQCSDAFLSFNLIRTLHPPQEHTVREFLSRWGIDNERALHVLFDYLTQYHNALHVDIFGRLLSVINVARETDIRFAAIRALSKTNPPQLGRFLLDAGWTLGSTESSMEADCAGRAILAASEQQELKELVPSVPAWLLLGEAHRRGGASHDAKAVAGAVSRSLSIEDVDVEDFNVKISVSLVDGPGFLSFAPMDADEDEALALFMDSEAERRRRDAAHSQGRDFIRRAQATGATMATKIVRADQVRMLVEHCTADVGLWLDGHESMTPAFCKRLNLAGGFYLALCEALLQSDWRLGSSLWHAIDKSLRVDFVGVGEVNELIHIPFRVALNPGVLALRRHLYSLGRNTTDRSYLDLAISAYAHGQANWLREQATQDLGASASWRRKRGLTVSGFLSEDTLESPVWPAGPSNGIWDWLRRRAQFYSINQALARYWWREYLQAKDATGAYAAWQLFMHCADRRALCWMDAEMALCQSSGELWRLKVLHMKANKSKLLRAMRKKEEKSGDRIERELFGWDSPTGWFDGGQLASLG